MDPLECGVMQREGLCDRRIAATYTRHAVHPVLNERRNLSPVRWFHSFREGLDVVASPVARTFLRSGLRVGDDFPDRGQHLAVELSDFGDREQLVATPAARFNRLSVH